MSDVLLESPTGTPNSSDELINEGVTFNNVRAALAMLYFGVPGMTQDYWTDALEHVVPMQHNLESPIIAGKEEGWVAKDTYIQYFIDEDDKITQDSKGQGFTIDDSVLPNEDIPVQTSVCDKAARVTVRFLGAQAEAWAKLMHHLTRRQEVSAIFYEYCHASFLEYPGPIRPMCVDYFSVANTTIAFDTTFVLQYREVIAIPGRLLGLITIAAGDIEL